MDANVYCNLEGRITRSMSHATNNLNPKTTNAVSVGLYAMVRFLERK